MMRKDVRIGFAIGGVLLAVLIVYGLVTSGPNPRDNEVTLAPDDPGAAAQSANGQKPAPANGTSGATNPQTSAPSGASDPVTSGTVERGASATGTNGGAGPLASNPQTNSPTTAPADKWERALTTGALMATERTETPSSPAGTTSVTPAPETAVAPQPEQPLAGSGANPTPTDSSTANNGTTSGNSGGAFDARELTRMATGGATAAPPAPSPTGSSTGSTPAPGQRTHTVQPNETFASIAEVAYGSQHYYPHLVRANPKVDPKRLRAGMEIVLPSRDQVVVTQPIAPDAAPLSLGTGTGTSTGAPGATAALPPIDEKTQYRVQPSESLYKISLKLYGKADKVDAIYNLNKDAIGPNPSRLRAGLVLKLPEPPTAGATAAR